MVEEITPAGMMPEQVGMRGQQWGQSVFKGRVEDVRQRPDKLPTQESMKANVDTVKQDLRDGEGSLLQLGLHDLTKIIDSLKQMFVGLSARLDFDLYNSSGRWYVRVIDRQTQEVIKTMPPEELLKYKSNLRKVFTGFLMDQIS
jgi:flagellar protein FlaG